MKTAIVVIAASLSLLGGCDQIKQRMGFPDPARQEAEGKAIGGACRHAGRGLEDCYRLNPKAGKADIFTGWKEMNEYMIKNNMQAVPPDIPADDAAGHAKPTATDKEMPAAAAPTGKKAEDKAAKPDVQGKPAAGH